MRHEILGAVVLAAVFLSVGPRPERAYRRDHSRQRAGYGVAVHGAGFRMAFARKGEPGVGTADRQHGAFFSARRCGADHLRRIDFGQPGRDSGSRRGEHRADRGGGGRDAATDGDPQTQTQNPGGRT